MPANKLPTIVLAVFGLAVIGSGLIRYLTTDAGQNGLYFGLVTGGLALIGALLVGVNQLLLGRIVGGFAIAVVIMWFSYDMYGDIARTHAIGTTEVRKSLIILVGIGAAIVLAAPRRK